MLVVLRIVGFAVAIALGLTVTAWVATGDRKWLRLTWQIFKFAVYGLAFVLVLFAAEALFHAG